MPTPKDYKDLLDVMSMFQILEEPNLTVYIQVDFPKSRKKRIREKWRKNASNWRNLPDPTIYRLGNNLVCHPETANFVREKAAEYLTNAFDASTSPIIEILANPDPPSRI